MSSSLKNSNSFGSGQGNVLNYPGSYIKFIGLGFMFFLAFIIFIFRDKIQNKFANKGSILFFKSDIVMGQTIGIIGLLFSVVRLILFIMYGYPRYGENLQLHLCRMHIGIMFALMAMKKIKLFKYIVIFTIMGSFIGILFSVGGNSNLNDNSNLYTYKTNDTNPSLVNLDIDTITNNAYFGDKQGLKQATNFEVLLVFDNFKYYRLGLDNFVLYDLYLSHILLWTLPLFIFVAYKQEYKIMHFLRTQLIYFSIFVFFGLLNIALNYVPDLHGKSNIGYVGMNRNNDFKNVLGGLSIGPQNLFTFSIMGIIIMGIIYIMGMKLGQIHFYNKGKVFGKPTIQKTKVFKNIISQFHKNIFKEACGFKE